MHSMHSNKIPITMRADTSRSQFNASKPAALCAVGDLEDLDDTFDAPCMVDLAAMTTRQEESTKKRKGNTLQDTSRKSCPRRHMDDRPHSPRPPKTPGTVSPGAPPSGGRGRASTGRGKASPRSSSLPKRRNQMPRSRPSSSSYWTTAFVSSTRGANNAPAWLTKGVALTHTHSSLFAGVERREPRHYNHSGCFFCHLGR